MDTPEAVILPSTSDMLGTSPLDWESKRSLYLYSAFPINNSGRTFLCKENDVVLYQQHECLPGSPKSLAGLRKAWKNRKTFLCPWEECWKAGKGHRVSVLQALCPEALSGPWTPQGGRRPWSPTLNGWLCCWWVISMDWGYTQAPGKANYLDTRSQRNNSQGLHNPCLLHMTCGSQWPQRAECWTERL